MKNKVGRPKGSFQFELEGKKVDCHTYRKKLAQKNAEKRVLMDSEVNEDLREKLKNERQKGRIAGILRGIRALQRLLDDELRC